MTNVALKKQPQQNWNTGTLWSHMRLIYGFTVHNVLLQVKYQKY